MIELFSKLRSLISKQKIRFLLVGGFNTLFGYFMFVLVNSFMGPSGGYLVSLLVAHMISSTVAFNLYRRYVFQDGLVSPLAFIKFQSVYLVPLISNLVILPILVEALDWNIYIAQAAFSLTWVVGSFFAHKYFSFKVK